MIRLPENCDGATSEIKYFNGTKSTQKEGVNFLLVILVFSVGPDIVAVRQIKFNNIQSLALEINA